MFLGVEEEPRIAVVINKTEQKQKNKNMRTLYVTKQRKHGERRNTRYLYQKVLHRWDSWHGQMVSLGEETGKANDEEEHLGWPHFFKAL